MIQGQAPQVAILPDLRYITSKVVVTKAVDLLEQFLQKKQGSSDAASPPSTETEADPLGQLLERALRKHKTKTETP